MAIYASYTDGNNGYIAKISLDGKLITTWDLGSDQDGVVQPFYNGLAVDSDDNVYYTTLGTKLNIVKRNRHGKILLTKNISGVTAVYSIAVGPDGYIYTLEFAGLDIDWRISKRNASDLEVVDTMIISDAASHPSVPYSDIFHGLTIRANRGYFYFVRDDIETHDRTYELWIWGHLSPSAILETANYPYACLSAIGVTMINVLSNGVNTGVWRVMNISSEEFVELEGMNCPENVGDDDTYFYFIGYEGTWGDHVNLLIEKYEVNGLVKVWTLTIPNSSNYVAGSINASTYEEAGDYSLAPILFPARVKRKKEALQLKCALFEKSMEDVCLVFNNNVKVTRLYLQETYGDAIHGSSSNLREILPSQQLVKLRGKDPDYNAIIRNFISNISDMFTLINEDNTLIKQWLDDYVPDEAGHEFTDVKMPPMVVGEDLSKAMEDLFAGIEDNVTILNTNIEMLTERF